jgi:hypothetical protein
MRIQEAASDSAQISYEPVDVSLVPPRDRSYGKVSATGGAAAKVTATTSATKEVGSPTPAGV